MSMFHQILHATACIYFDYSYLLITQFLILYSKNQIIHVLIYDLECWFIWPRKCNVHSQKFFTLRRFTNYVYTRSRSVWWLGGRIYAINAALPVDHGRQAVWHGSRNSATSRASSKKRNMSRGGPAERAKPFPLITITIHHLSLRAAPLLFAFVSCDPALLGSPFFKTSCCDVLFHVDETFAKKNSSFFFEIY